MCFALAGYYNCSKVLSSDKILVQIGFSLVYLLSWGLLSLDNIHILICFVLAGLYTCPDGFALAG